MPAPRFTATALSAGPVLQRLSWVTAGGGFVAIELIAHGVLALRGRPSFYSQRG